MYISLIVRDAFSFIYVHTSMCYVFYFPLHLPHLLHTPLMSLWVSFLLLLRHYYVCTYVLYVVVVVANINEIYYMRYDIVRYNKLLDINALGPFTHKLSHTHGERIREETLIASQRSINRILLHQTLQTRSS